MVLCVVEVKQAVNILWEQVSGRQIRKTSSSFILLHCSCCGSLELIYPAKVFLRLALIFIFITFTSMCGTQSVVPQLVKLFIASKLCWQYHAVSKTKGLMVSS